jgi:hypothetical protein
MIDETWDPIIEAQLELQGNTVMQLIASAAEAEVTMRSEWSTTMRRLDFEKRSRQPRRTKIITSSLCNFML